MSELTMQNSLYETIESGKFSDLTLCLQDGTNIKCHRVVMCTQCEFFDNAVKPGRFKESSGVINLENDPPQAIRRMVEFLYTGKYTTDHEDHDILELSSNEYDKAMYAHTQVYIVSAVYRIPGLQEMSSNFIRPALTYRTLDILPWIFQQIDSGVPASVCSLRGDLTNFARMHVVDLTSGDRFQHMMDMVPAFMEFLMHDLAKSNQRARSGLRKADRRIAELEAKVSSSPEYCYQCPHCCEFFNTVMPAFRVRVGCPFCGVTRLTSSWNDCTIGESST